MSWENGFTMEMRVERVEEPRVFGYTWQIYGLPKDDPRRTYVEFTLEPVGAGTRMRAGQDGRQKRDADRQPTGGVAQAQALHDMHRHRRQRHGDREIGKKQNRRQDADATGGRVGPLRNSHGDALRNGCVG